MLYGIIATLVAAFSIHQWWNSPRQVARRALRTVTRTTIRDAKDGARVKVVGAARSAGAQLVAPFTQRPCFIWQIVVQEYRSSGRSGSWHDLVNESEERDFDVEDATGRAAVKVTTVRLALVEDGTGSAGTFQDASPELARFCAERGIETTGWFGMNKSIRYREAVLEEGETVAVMGVARWESDPSVNPEGGYRSVGKRLVLDAPDDDALVISDMPDTTV